MNKLERLLKKDDSGNELLLLFGAVAALVSSSLAVYKLLNRRRCNIRSFWEIYEDNAVSMNWGDDNLD